jgi:alternate signal-mediated exported protein
MTVHLDTPAAQPVAKRSSGRMKGILAIAAGTALLLGGTGTYAYWSTTQALSAEDIVSGDLDLALGDGTWTLDGIVGAPVTVTDLATVRLVPGDVLTLDQDVDVTLIGDTIQAVLAIDTTGVIPAGAESNFTVAFATGGIGTSAGTNAYRLTPANAADPLETTVTITFNGPGTTLQQYVNTTLNLTAIDFNLTQASS